MNTQTEALITRRKTTPFDRYDVTDSPQRMWPANDTFAVNPFSYPEPFLRTVRRGALAKSITGYHKNMVIEYIRY